MHIHLCAEETPCGNRPLLQEFGEDVQNREDAARDRTGAGVVSGQLVCSGVIRNKTPDIGSFCGASLTRTIFTDHPELDGQVCAVTAVDQIPGYHQNT